MSFPLTLIIKFWVFLWHWSPTVRQSCRANSFLALIAACAFPPSLSTLFLSCKFTLFNLSVSSFRKTLPYSVPNPYTNCLSTPFLSLFSHCSSHLSPQVIGFFSFKYTTLAQVICFIFSHKMSLPPSSLSPYWHLQFYSSTSPCLSISLPSISSPLKSPSLNFTSIPSNSFSHVLIGKVFD